MIILHQCQGLVISIHAPREGSDVIEDVTDVLGLISIHAPREGSDRRQCRNRRSRRDFNPRSP